MKKGSVSSAKGTTMNTENGNISIMSDSVRWNCTGSLAYLPPLAIKHLFAFAASECVSVEHAHQQPPRDLQVRPHELEPDLQR